MNRGIQKNKAWALGLALMSASSMADTTTAATAAAPAQSVTATAAAPATGGSIFGELDIRPTANVTGSSGTITETSIEAGYQFNPTVRLTYALGFDTNLGSSAIDNDLKLYNSFVRLRVAKILESDDKSLSLNYQARVYLPTDAAERAKGYVSTVRNYATLKKKFNDTLTMTLSEVPMLHGFTKAGVGNSANKGVFENMVVLDATINLIGPVSLYIPIILQSAQYQDFKAGAKRNGQMVHTLWTWPELGVAISDKHTVGLSYRSANLATENLSELTLKKGIDSGVAQLFWTANL